MDSVFSIIIFVIVSTVMVIILRTHDGSIAFMITVAASVLLLIVILPSIISVIESLQGVADLVSQGPFEVVVKAVGISVLTQLTADLCLDAGQRAMSTLVQLAGKVAIILAALPLLAKLLEELLAILG